MDPEIDRRCTSCGASVRSRSLFCPQCGKPIPHQATTSTPPEANTNVSDRGTAIPVSPEVHWDAAETRPLISISDLSETKPLVGPPTKVPDDIQVHQPQNLQEQTNVAPETVLGRVDKIRKVSSVVIDE